MRQKVHLLAILMAMLFSTSALAQVVDPMEAMVITPAEGTVTSLHNFTITFAGLPVVVRQDSIPTLMKGGGGTASGRMRAGDDGTSVLVYFDQTFTDPGQYFLNLPDASIIVNGRPLLPLTLRFIIEGTVESFYDQITIDPAEGEVAKLQYFTISFPQYVGEITYGSMAILTNNTTQQSYYTEMIGVGYSVLVYFPDEVTEAGDYTLTIPAGSINIFTLGEDVRELVYHYSIVGTPDFILGDVDGDGHVNIADVTALIDILLSGAAATPAADVDSSDSVNIADVTTLIDMLLSAH